MKKKVMKKKSYFFYGIYGVSGILLLIGTLVTGSHGLAKENMEVYKAADALQSEVDRMQFPGFKLKDYPVRFYDGDSDYVVSSAASGVEVKKEPPVFETYVGSVTEVDGNYQVALPVVEQFSRLINAMGQAGTFLQEGLDAESDAGTDSGIKDGMAGSTDAGSGDGTDAGSIDGMAGSTDAGSGDGTDAGSIDGMAGSTDSESENGLADNTYQYGKEDHVATLWHEAFHAYQWTYFEDEILGLVKEDLPEDASFEEVITAQVDSDASQTVKIRQELELLKKIYACGDLEEKKTLISSYLELERERKSRLGDTARWVETYYETLEGTARFVESFVYEAENGMAAYEKRYVENAVYCRGAEKYYQIGMLKCRILDQIRPGWEKTYDFSYPLEELL